MGSKEKNAAARNTEDKVIDEIDTAGLEELDRILGIIHGAPFTEKKSKIASSYYLPMTKFQKYLLEWYLKYLFIDNVRYIPSSCS